MSFVIEPTSKNIENENENMNCSDSYSEKIDLHLCAQESFALLIVFYNFSFDRV